MAGPSEQRWLDAIADRRSRPEMPVFGYRTVPADWHVARRSLSEHLLYFVVERGFEGRVGRRNVQVGPNGLMWLAPGTVHELAHPPGAGPMKLFYLRVRLQRRGVDLHAGRKPVVLHHAGELRPWFEELYAEHQAALRFREARLRSLLGLLMCGLFRLRQASVQPGPVLTGTQRHRILTYTAEHLTAWPQPDQLARVAKLSPDYFARLFRRSFGQSPRTWLLHQRIRRAADRLTESTLTISEVADELGYADLFLFSRQFKQVMGRSPRAYRRTLAPAGKRG